MAQAALSFPQKENGMGDIAYYPDRARKWMEKIGNQPLYMAVVMDYAIILKTEEGDRAKEARDWFLKQLIRHQIAEKGKSNGKNLNDVIGVILEFKDKAS